MTMWEPVALCCFTRRTGCLVLGSLEVIGAIFSLLAGTYLWIERDIGALNFVCHQPRMPSMEACEEGLRHEVSTIVAIAIFSGVVQMVCASMMIHGVRKNIHCLMTPFLIKNAVALVLVIILAGIGVLVVFTDEENFVLGIIGAYVYGAIIFMWTYFLLTVRAYYYELKRGKADDCRLLIEHGVTKDEFLVNCQENFTN